MKPFEFDSRSFPRRMTFRRWMHENQFAGRIFATVCLALVIPVHAIVGASQQIRDGGINEFVLLFRMAFAPWKDRNLAPKETNKTKQTKDLPAPANQGGAAT